MDSSRLIRAATVDDAPSLLAIYGAIVRETAISFEIEPPNAAELADRIAQVTSANPWLVLEQAGTVAGYAYATPYRHRPAYATTRETTVYVAGDHRRSGVGHQLMTALLDEIAAQGARLAIAVIGLPNQASVALHESLGFLHAGTLHRVAWKFERWHDEGYWELPLGSDRPGHGG